jgi:protein Tex
VSDGASRLCYSSLTKSVVCAGADVNTASQHILARASGLSSSQAAAIVKHRAQHGPFPNLEALKKVKGIGPMTFQNAAGFLRVIGEEPLDRTIVHPEQYAVTRELLRALTGGSGSGKKLSSADISSLLFSPRLVQAVAGCDWASVQASVGGGALSVEALQTLARWVSDNTFSSTATADVRGIRGVAPRLQRTSLPQPADLTAGSVVEGTVRNITSFGVFVDIGAGDDALLHKSQYADKERVGFVIGERLPAVTILGVSAERGGKISLTLKPTGNSVAGGGGGGGGGTNPAVGSGTSRNGGRSGVNDVTGSSKKRRNIDEDVRDELGAVDDDAQSCQNSSKKEEKKKKKKKKKTEDEEEKSHHAKKKKRRVEEEE